jgi:hypothetical protein
MRKINCRSVRREIEHARPGGWLSSLANDHIKTCVACEKFREEDIELRQILSNLGTIEAPGDFDARVRARLAQEKRAGVVPFAIRNFSFGFRSAVFASLLLLFGSTLLVVSLRTPTQISLSANGEKSAPAVPGTPATDVSNNDGQQLAANTTSPQVNLAGARQDSTNSLAQPGRKRSGAFRTAVATARNNGRRLTTRDLGSSPAPVLRPEDLTAGNRHSSFPIGASSRSLKVSLDNGRGSKRTISLPTVSFGSQRVLAQDTSPLLATARGSW